MPGLTTSRAPTIEELNGMTLGGSTRLRHRECPPLCGDIHRTACADVEPLNAPTAKTADGLQPRVIAAPHLTRPRPMEPTPMVPPAARTPPPSSTNRRGRASAAPTDGNPIAHPLTGTLEMHRDARTCYAPFVRKVNAVSMTEGRVGYLPTANAARGRTTKPLAYL